MRAVAQRFSGYKKTAAGTTKGVHQLPGPLFGFIAEDRIAPEHTRYFTEIQIWDNVHVQVKPFVSPVRLFCDRREFMRILLAMTATVFAYVVLYSPQPLLPFLANTFGVAKSQAALLITVTMLPMSIAPLSYGYLLESISATKILRWAILL